MKRKKKPTSYEKIKIAAAQYRNDFFRKMRLIINGFCGNDIYKFIPTYILDEVYCSRGSPFKFKVGANVNIPASIFKYSKESLPKMFREETILLTPYNFRISFVDYFMVVITIDVLYLRIRKGNFNIPSIVKETLKSIVDYFSASKEFELQLAKFLCIFNCYDNDLRKVLYWHSHEPVVPKFYPSEIENFITIRSVTPETIAVNIDGSNRPAVRVGWAYSTLGPVWASIKPADLGMHGILAEVPLPVYIQSHAIMRLLERVDCFLSGVAQMNIYESLISPTITYDQNHKLLIEYSVFKTKIGYFRADIVDGIILIRTFLFITNSGTPEGDLLEKNLGLQKSDKQYLAIDKLSTFMNSDLDTNLIAQQLFIDSGCQCLIDVYFKLKPIAFKKENITKFNFMLSYINTHKENTDLNEKDSLIEKDKKEWALA